VLADGSVHWVSGDAPDRVGLDLCGVLVGSEGTLCTITKIKVRLLRTPPSVATLLAAFPTIDSASQAVSAVIGHGIVPAALEMMDQVTVGAVEAHYHAGYPTDAGAVLLVEVDGIPESTRELISAIRDVLGANHGYAMREAQTQAERDLLWAGRKGAIGALGRIKPNYYLHDGVVPRSRLPQILSAVGEIGIHYKLPVANVFHAGDGNLHPNILFDLRDTDVWPQVESAGEEMLRAVVELGGALSGEHGIGLEKSAFMPWVYSPDDLDAMRRVKGALDGAGIMNPGKIFPDPEHKRPHLAGRTGLAVEAKWWGVERRSRSRPPPKSSRECCTQRQRRDRPVFQLAAAEPRRWAIRHRETASRYIRPRSIAFSSTRKPTWWSASKPESRLSRSRLSLERAASSSPSTLSTRQATRSAAFWRPAGPVHCACDTAPRAIS